MTREEAIQELQNCKGLIQQDGQDYLDERDIPLLDMAIEALSTNPKEEFESAEVVRCKDCRHAEHRKQMPNQIYCKRDKLSTFCALHDDDDFCKYGERKE